MNTPSYSNTTTPGNAAAALFAARARYLIGMTALQWFTPEEEWGKGDDGSSSSLGSASLLSLPGGASKPPPATSHTHQATLYPTAGEATVTRRARASGEAFRLVTVAGGVHVERWEGDTPVVSVTPPRELRRWQEEARVAERAARMREAEEGRELLEQSPDLSLSEARRWGRYERGLRAERREEWREECRARSEEANARRAASKLRRYCRHNRLDHLVTLTYAGDGCREWSDVVTHWRRFMQAWNKHKGQQEMAAVIEPHPGGHGFHIHIGMHGKVDIPALRKCWRRGYGRGIDVTWLGKKNATRGGAPPKRCAQYLAKYVAKGLMAEECAAAGLTPRKPGQHRYFIAEGSSPERLRFYAYSRQECFDLLRSYMGAPAFVWCSDALPQWNAPRCHYLDYWADDPRYAPRGALVPVT